jgi:branched-chain amino acid transport system permease protein
MRVAIVTETKDESWPTERGTMTLLMIGVLAGLAFASIYLLIAISFTLVVGVSGVVNFLQASLVMLATVATYVLVERGWNPVLALPLLLVGGAAVGVFTDWLLIRPAQARSDHLIETALLTTLGASTVIAAVTTMRFGSDTKTVETYVSSEPWQVGSIPISKTVLLIIVVTLAVAVFFEQVLRRTTVGRVTRVTLEDRDAAQLAGINVKRVQSASFAVAGAVSVLAGWLIVPLLGAAPSNAEVVAFYAFGAMAIGGFGSFSGAVVGALFVGLVRGITPAYLSASWTLVIVVLAIMAFLIVRPAGLRGIAGLFGAKSVREI